MKINTNRWNRIRYTIYAPIYNNVFIRVLSKPRKQSINALTIKENAKILIVGAGTGLDLDFLPPHAKITATDLTPAMVSRIRKRANRLNVNVEALVMDGQKLAFSDATFDIVILHLILAVIPNPIICLQESERVLKPQGQIAIFDKFKNTKQTISWCRQLLNVFFRPLFSDINRDIYTILKHTNLKIISDNSSIFWGWFRLLKLKKC